ncbi:hypothetical protein MZD04_gp299 [Pseudomonas phage Psa21]|uniref:Uncharacterized protein n=1 Tax=Pseudomonas phage Psa21 TaxID=2530023 RepID=A0A481W5P8_9CAUD|nr:hypothetical protein MZD04_gp299 [Pseudomonas phage Psa21]QBJ02825.1 hypothetical protein PSA21_299 [Pseudomonas phage Psa21]
MQQVQTDTNMCRVMMNAMIQWMIDTNMAQRIHVVTDATMFDVGILKNNVNGLYQIVLNIAASAVRNFSYNEHTFSFNCSNNGVDVPLNVPYEAVLGFLIPTAEGYTSFFPIPNMERELLALQKTQNMLQELDQLDLGDDAPSMAQLNELMRGVGVNEPAKPVESSPYAVHGLNTNSGEDDTNTHANSLPTNVELMRRKPFTERPVAKVEKEAPRPLLDFGPVGGVVFQSKRPRRKDGPNLTLIQGGKK